MNRFLLVLICALALIVSVAYAVTPTVRPQPTLVSCYPLVEDFNLRLALTICLFRLPDPPLEPPVPEKEARRGDLGPAGPTY